MIEPENVESENDDNYALVLNKRRHLEAIEWSNCATQSWRMKERVCINRANNFYEISTELWFCLHLTDEDCLSRSRFVLECWRRSTGFCENRSLCST